MNDIVKFRVNDVEITGVDILSTVDGILNHVRQTNDLAVAENALRGLKGIERISGMAIARLLSGLQDWWEETNQEELTQDSFQDWIYSIDTEFSTIYLRRCVDIHRYEDSGIFSDKIQALPIKIKQDIASHLSQGYTLSKAEWRELEQVSNDGEARVILRKSKGKPPRKNTLMISLERDGSITLWYQGEAFFGGYIPSANKAQSEKEREALEKWESRFLKGTGASEK